MLASCDGYLVAQRSSPASEASSKGIATVREIVIRIMG
jgi:hypothetical protein